MDYLDSEAAQFDFKSLSVPDAIKKAEMWLKSLTRGKAAREVPGEIPVKTYSDGFKWLKLTSRESLDREGKLMGHCVGSYYEKVAEEGTEIYSLRDPKNEPHCTIEVTDREIQQIKGKQNKEVVSKYHSYVQDFVNTQGFELGDGGDHDLTKAGMIRIGKQLMTLDQFQASKNLKVDGSLDLRRTKVTSLPKDLKVGGYLDLNGTKVTSLPKDLKVGGGLYLSDTPIKSLPDGLEVGGNLDLRGTKVTSLPDGLKVGGYLYLSNTPITSLPDGLKVGGSLDLHGTKITSLPDNLKVGGNLDLHDTKITSLPDNLKVGGYLYLRRTKIKKDDFKKPPGVKGEVFN